jgi:hypothetical protein
MRKKEAEIADRAEVLEVLSRAPVVHLGLAAGDQPYVVPLFFALDGETVYLHTGREGRKMDMLAANPRVCLQAEVGVELRPAADPCRWSARYQSVVGFGTAELVPDGPEKRRALAVLMDRYAGGGSDWSFPPDKLDATAVVKVVLEEFCGRRRGGAGQGPPPEAA